MAAKKQSLVLDTYVNEEGVKVTVYRTPAPKKKASGISASTKQTLRKEGILVGRRKANT